MSSRIPHSIRLGAALFLLSAPVLADPQGRVKEGLAHFDQQEYEAARAAFAAAYAEAPSVGTLLNLALSELNAGRPLDALHHFREYVASPEAKREKVTRIQEELLPRAYRATGHLRVDGAGAASVAIDGAPARDAGAAIDVLAGKHTVEVKGAGREPARVDVDAKPGEVVVVELVAVSASHPQPPSLRVSPQPHLPVLQGDKPSFWSARTILGGSLGVAALFAGGIGAGFVVASNGAAASAAELRSGLAANACAGAPTPACAALKSQVDDQYSSRDRAVGLFIGAGVLGLASAATFLFWPEAKRPAPVLPTAAPTSGGLTLGLVGRF